MVKQWEWARRPRGHRHRSGFDWQLLTAAGLLSAGLGVGLAALFDVWATRRHHIGPTSASLDEAFSAFLGLSIGVAAGAAAAAVLVRRGPRISSGVAASFLGYTLVVVPVLFLTAADDVTTGETAELALLLAAILVPVALVGAAAGDLAARWSSQRARL
jgi:hypothetical protein